MSRLSMQAGSLPQRIVLEAKKQCSLAGPLIIINIAPFLFTFINLAFLGRIGMQELAAGALGLGLFNLVLAVLTGIDSAAMALFATIRGERYHIVRKTQVLLHQAIWVALFATLIATPLFLFTTPLLNMLGQEPELAAMAGHMTIWLILAVFPYSVFKILRALVGVHGSQKDSFVAVLAGVAVNFALCWWLVRAENGMETALRGVGISVVCATLVMLLMTVGSFSYKANLQRLRIWLGSWQISGEMIGMLIKLAIPISLTMFFEVAIFYAAMIAVGFFGEIQLAAHTITLQIVSFAFKIPTALGQAATIRVAYFAGARKLKDSFFAGWVAYGVGISFACLAASLMLFMPYPFIALFVDIHAPENADVVQFASILLICGGIFQIADATQVVLLGMLRGLRDTTMPMVFAAIGYWGLGLPIGLVFGFWLNWQSLGIWIGLAAGLFTMSGLLTYRWFKRVEAWRLAG